VTVSLIFFRFAGQVLVFSIEFSRLVERFDMVGVNRKSKINQKTGYTLQRISLKINVKKTKSLRLGISEGDVGK